MRDLEREHSDTQWHYFSTGHSLGALMATALAIDEDGKIERCATFESPGLIKFWRNKADEHGEEHWRSRIINYLTFPSAPPHARRAKMCAQQRRAYDGVCVLSPGAEVSRLW